MDEESFRRKLGEILGVMDHTAVEQRGNDGDWSEQLRDSVARLHAAVDHLRLRVKYLVFDLEATRRENTYLRTMLDRASRGDEGGGRGPHE